MSVGTFRIRVRVAGGAKLSYVQLKDKLGKDLFIQDAGGKKEFVVCADTEERLKEVRAKLAEAGVEEVLGGATDVAAPNAGGAFGAGPRRTGPAHRQPPAWPPRVGGGGGLPPQQAAPGLRNKPYAFVSLPETFSTATPIWHDGSGTKGRLSGEVRFELRTLTPMLVGCERQKVVDRESSGPWPLMSDPVAASTTRDDFLRRAAEGAYPDPAPDPNAARFERKVREVHSARRDYLVRQAPHVVSLVGVGLSAMPNEATWVTKEKAVLWPLRAPWVHGPVLIPGDSLKGLLRHELGAILGAPMERVAERSYSYRPNSLYVDPRSGPRLVARIARIPAGAVQRRSLDPKDPDSPKVSVPTSLELLSLDLRYDRDHALPASWYRFDPRVGGGDPYRGGQGAGATLNSKKRLHRRVGVNPSGPTTSTPVPIDVIEGYLHTLRHLTDTQYGHFSERHPDVGTTLSADAAGAQILQAAQSVVFQPGDLIWVEWDTVGEGRIVSFGWHYYYRWAYQDTVRHVGWRYTRRAGLFPLPDELQNDPANLKLSAVRRLFGYTGDNAGSKDIGRGDPNHSQLMGRLFVNAALELVSASDTDETRFLKPTFLKELGMPRPSAVEHYLKQPHHPGSRPCDNASLVTYGDAAGYDTPGTLAGRKFYLDRPDAYTGTPWAEDSPANRLNDRSTLALQASAPQRPFRFTLRFRDLDAAELVAVLLAFCPNQFGKLVNGKHPDGYCSKLGYARPLGWGSVRIEAKEMLLLDTDTAPDAPALKPEHVASWFQLHLKELQAAKLPEWLAIHRHKHPDAADYPRPKGQPNGPIYTYHTQLRAEHSRLRRYPPRGR